MKKLNVAIIGQGRSGRMIHGAYFLSERNQFYQVKYIVEQNESRRKIAEEMYPGCTVLTDYRELFGLKDVDLVVNASFSEMHCPITKDLLAHGFNVLSEKPLAANRAQAEDLVATAKANHALLAVFQNTQLAPFYLEAKRLIDSGRLGKIEQISLRYNGFSRRWDWQTLQKKLGGSAYNTGPHPFFMAMGFLDYADDVELIYSKLDSTPLTSGDADDYVKVLLTAPGKPLIDLEITSTDAYSDYNLKIQGTKGTLKSTPTSYQYKYIVDGENAEQPLQEASLEGENHLPVYCSEKFITHEECGAYNGSAFDVGCAAIYENIYHALTEGASLIIPPEYTFPMYEIFDRIHKDNPLPIKFK